MEGLNDPAAHMLSLLLIRRGQSRLAPDPSIGGGGDILWDYPHDQCTSTPRKGGVTGESVKSIYADWKGAGP
jgi:hypothetical protein